MAQEEWEHWSGYLRDRGWTQGDNRNYFASMMAKEVYGVRRVLCRVYDPGREKIFHDFGLETFSPTSLGAQTMVDMLLQQKGQ